MLSSTKESLKRDHCDIAIIGGGLSGSLAAIHLAREGFHVVVFEKELVFGEQACEELLSFEALPLLRELGLDPLAFGGVELTGLRVHGPTASVDLKPPRRAIGISRAVLDEALLKLAVEAGADVRRGVTAFELLEGLDETTGSILISTSHSETRCQRLIVASGSVDLFGRRQGRDSSYIGFETQVRLKPSSALALGHSRDLFSFQGGYGALTALGHGLVNVSFVMDRTLVHSLGTSWDALTAHIGKSNWTASHYLDGAVPQSSEFASISESPFGYLRRDPAPAGVFFVGDQMAVMPPVAGEGATIALMTARRAVEAIVAREWIQEMPLAGRLSAPSLKMRFAPEASREYQRDVRTILRPQIESAMALHTAFKKPGLIDFSTFALRAFPSLFLRAFRTTRCQLIPTAPRPRVPSGPKQAVAGSLR